uniref:SIAH-type domain-containing protein n=1 Tax=Timema monikensis TaxID=170555 RepID=A0A7R9HU15_9NEOP|nr:unnamed protein product [Timema monikensis]
MKVSACPTCKCHLGDIRNRFAETIAEKVTYLCRYVKRGCRELLSIADKFSHEEECASRPCICRICASWCGEFSELLEHVRAAHLHRLRNEDINTVHCKYFNENTSSELVILLTFQGEMFWWHSKRDVQNRMFYEVLQYIGDKEEALKFRYRHKFTTAFGDQQIIITNRTFPDSTNGERHGVASQPTKVSFRANKNRCITETVDGASYRTGLAEKS